MSISSKNASPSNQEALTSLQVTIQDLRFPDLSLTVRLIATQKNKRKQGALPRLAGGGFSPSPNEQLRRNNVPEWQWPIGRKRERLSSKVSLSKRS